MTLDLVTLVNEQDEVLGSMDKVEAHRWPAKLHRASSVFLFRKTATEPELLLQCRSQKKIVGAGQWANTCCGNVWPDESYEACARRRLSFELGVTKPIELREVIKFHYQVQCNEEFGENEVDTVFVGWLSDEPQPNPDEVSKTKWVPWSQAKLQAEQAPWFSIMLHDQKVMTAVEKALQTKKE